MSTTRRCWPASPPAWASRCGASRSPPSAPTSSSRTGSREPWGHPGTAPIDVRSGEGGNAARRGPGTVRILQVSPFYAPHRGGVESHVRGLASELHREGHDVRVLTSRHDRRLPESEVIDGVPVTRVRSLGVLYNTPLDVGMS